MSAWLPDMDLNHDKQIQSLLCYRYTIGQTRASKVGVPGGSQGWTGREGRTPKAERRPNSEIRRSGAGLVDQAAGSVRGFCRSRRACHRGTRMPAENRLILKYADEPGYTPDLECYLRHGGYEALKKALAIPPKTLPDGKQISGAEQIRDEVKLSGLRGRGGAGFSCGLKWSFVDRKSGKPIYLICNADESEPGTFKDKQILYKDPHQMIEGMIISCYANDVHLAYIYIRGEFVEGAKILNRALKEARAKNFLGKNILGSGYDLEIHVHRGAGAYICGEETGLIESLEGKRAYPRIKPPYFPAVLGLYMCPTIVNNVETLCAVKHIVAMGGAEFARSWARPIIPARAS